MSKSRCGAAGDVSWAVGGAGAGTGTTGGLLCCCGAGVVSCSVGAGTSVGSVGQLKR